MKSLLWTVLLLLLFGVSLASAQTYYNPTTLAFQSPDHATATHYRAEYWLSGSPLTGTPIATADVPVSQVGIESQGPPVVYRIALQDIPVFLPFGKSYVMRLIVCQDAACSVPSEVTRETVRYTYCKNTDTTIKPMSLILAVPPIGTAGQYVTLVLTTDSVQPVHAISFQLVGAGVPAYYFTGKDLRGTVNFTVGPLPRAGRYLVNVSGADELGCSTSTGSQFLTVR